MAASPKFRPIWLRASKAGCCADGPIDYGQVRTSIGDAHAAHLLTAVGELDASDALMQAELPKAVSRTTTCWCWP